MSRLQTLQTLLEHEQAARDAALAAWQKLCLAEERARQQARQLDTYRDEYRVRWQARLKTAAPIEILRCVQGFTQRLDDAIGQQRHQLERQHDQAEAARERLMKCERRVTSVQRLIERCQRAALNAEARREQKMFDELAQRAGSHRATALVPGGPR
jgi:flagellar protein FliJ